jgi:hypothetical protein
VTVSATVSPGAGTKDFRDAVGSADGTAGAAVFHTRDRAKPGVWVNWRVRGGSPSLTITGLPLGLTPVTTRRTMILSLEKPTYC